ncbi:uncharacterized protein [Coffea arabica]|uniref:Replication factor A C-terminal domain-containing protein n=1 Tax=Coffea arabica TaxID=13443 RepID=A0ABM4VKY7_COFAR
MPRQISAILDIDKESDKWTVLIQVVERNHIQYTRKAPPRRIQRFVFTDSQQKTAWITGTAQLSFGQTRFCYTACSNCLKTVEADTDWIIKCSSCKEEVEVELRCRIGITLTDSTASIQCLISGKQAERLIQFTAAELKDGEAHGITINQELSTIMKKHSLICFIKTYETTFQGLPQRRNAIIKAYTAAEVPNIPLPLQDSPTTVQASPTTTPSNTKQKQIADEQMFTPRAKLPL